MKTSALWAGIALILLIIAGAAYWRYTARAPAPQPEAQTPVTHPSLSPDLYPLYTGVDWEGSVAERVTIGNVTYAGASIASLPVTNTMDPGSVFTPFEHYYAQKLRAAGWSVANDLAAGGHIGGQTGYQKGTDVILTRFHIEYLTTPQNAPSECPCNVTLSLFSATSSSVSH